MANLRDRVRVSTATTGTGTLALGAALPGYRTLASAYTAAVIVSYIIEDGTAWETGSGWFTPGANTLSRVMDASSTGALLNLSGSATVGVAYLSRDSVADWPFFEATFDANNGGAQGMAQGSFTTIRFDTVVADTHAGFSLANNIYTVRQAGTYDCLLKWRMGDGVAGGGHSYGVGVHSSNGDGPFFSWTLSNGAREGVTYRRVAPFGVGDELRAYYYFGDSPPIYISADLVIFRVR